jgi:hypothetical protein
MLQFKFGVHRLSINEYLGAAYYVTFPPDESLQQERSSMEPHKETPRHLPSYRFEEV